MEIFGPHFASYGMDGRSATIGKFRYFTLIGTYLAAEREAIRHVHNTDLKGDLQNEQIVCLEKKTGNTKK